MQPPRSFSIAACAWLAAWLAACGAHTAVRQAAPALSDVERLERLAHERAATEPQSFAIGVGDRVEVRFFSDAGMNRKLTVGARGDLRLPLIGSVKAVGLSDSELAEEIGRRFEEEHFEKAEVEVFVVEYGGRKAAVTGSVAKPGLYSLTREVHTLLDLLSEAGGLTSDAGSVIELIPASRAVPADAFASAGLQQNSPRNDDEAIAIDLGDLMRSAGRTEFNLPLVAGDVIFVPPAGDFTIEGWVETPGKYELSNGTTLLAAITIGGGTILPTRLEAVEVLRSRRRGEGRREIQVYDLTVIGRGEAADVPLRAGDIVRVPAWPHLIAPWALYRFMRTVISVGVGASVPVI